jgi:hypothetical protein
VDQPSRVSSPVIDQLVARVRIGIITKEKPAFEIEVSKARKVME